MAKLVAKSRAQKLSALEDHLFLLARSIEGLHAGDAAHLRDLAAKLRALVCVSHGLDGLLWRLRDELDVDDTIKIRYPGNVDVNNPLTRGLYFVCAPVDPYGVGDERVPLEPWAFRERIKHHEALYIDGKSITHETLISRLANETGTAHEADGISKEMAKINAILIGDVQPYFAILDADARLSLEIAERILSVAAAAGYERRRAPAEPPERRAIASVRFGTKLDVPAAVNKPIEGSVLFLLDLKGMGSAGTEILPLRFPPMSMSGVTLFAEVTRRHKLRLTAVGLPLPNFGCETAMPECGAQSIGIVLTWKGHDVRAYVAGEQVSGMRSAHY